MVSLPSPSKSNLLLISGSEEGGGSRSPAPQSLTPAVRPEPRKDNQPLLFSWGTRCTPCLQQAFLGGRCFSILPSSPDFPVAIQVRTYQGKSPHTAFRSFEKCVTEIQLFSACCLHILTVAFALQPCDALKALSLECLCA